MGGRSRFGLFRPPALEKHRVNGDITTGRVRTGLRDLEERGRESGRGRSFDHAPLGDQAVAGTEG